MARIHPTAIVDPSAELAEDLDIGPYVIIGKGVKIGPGAKIGPHVVIEHATIGNNLTVTANAFIGTPPQDLKYHDEPTRIIIGDDCSIRECVTLNRGSFKEGADGLTAIGNQCYFMAYSHVGHDCKVGDGVILTNCAALGGHVSVGDNAILGGLAGTHQFVRIGAGAMIGGATGVERDIPPFCLAEGNRAQLLGINIIGLKRRGAGRQTIALMRRAFDALFLNESALEASINMLEKEELKIPELQELINFLKVPSKRGITRARNKTAPPQAAP